jgi:hypothetical protein
MGSVDVTAGAGGAEEIETAYVPGSSPTSAAKEYVPPLITAAVLTAFPSTCFGWN